MSKRKAIMTTTLQHGTSTLPDIIDVSMPDGDVLGNEILCSVGEKATKQLLRSAKIRKSSGIPRIEFQPRGWTMGGRVD